MAVLDKQSIRDEFDKVKLEFKKLAEQGNVSPEVSILFTSLILLFNIVLAIFLERATKKTSANSSIPPSQTGKDESTSPSKNTNSNGQKENITVAANTRTVETLSTSVVEKCNRCGYDLSATECKCIERRTRKDRDK